MAAFSLLLLSLVNINKLANAKTMKNVPFSFFAKDEPLRNVLTSLATNANVGIFVSPEVNDDFNGHIDKKTTQKALSYLADAYDLIWYFDRSTLFIYKSNEMQSKMFRLNTMPTKKLQQTLASLKLWDKRFDWRSMNDSGIVMVSGPPRYLELIDTTIALLQNRSKLDHSDPLEVKIIKLNHASVIDRKFTARGQDVIMPGVASIVSNMMGDENDDIQTNTNYNDQPVNSKTESQSSSKEKQTKLTSQGAAHPLAKIQADQSLNAIIIQDYRSRIHLYEALITQLDQPRKQLEISLHIIDITSNSLEQIGVNWEAGNIQVGKGLVDLILPAASSSNNRKKTSAEFLATVSLLETQGKARVMSQPAVVTENGIQAVLDNNETFYVKVQGERVAELKDITYGTLLQVTPRIVEGDTPKRIYLDINIEDGNRLLDGDVDSLPSIKNTHISTRASVPEGASLLIGGYSRESESNAEQNVPILSDIPFLGRLFSNQTDVSTQVVRLFMISPKIISLKDLERPANEDMNQPFSFSRQIKEMSNLSNASGRIYSMGNLQPCELSMDARIRRNKFSAKGYGTKITGCRNFGGTDGFRVTLTSCPPRSKELECQL